MSIKKDIFAPLASGLGATRRAAMLLLVMMLTTVTAWADTVTLKSDTKSWENNTYVANGEVNIADRITVTGNVTLILTDGCTLRAPNGIEVRKGNSLTIEGGTNGTGTLTIEGGTRAGIGGGYKKSTWSVTYLTQYGDITINGGIVNVQGGNQCAGIGGDFNSELDDNGTITINGGVVNATGGTGAAGIGGGYDSNKNGAYGGCGAIVINGGQVTATGGGDGPGIGPGKTVDDNSSGSLVLGWTNTTDFIKVTGVKSNLKVVYGFSNRLGSINFANNKKFNISGGNEATIEDIKNLESLTLIPKGSEQHQLSEATISGISASYDLTGSYLDIPFSVSDAEEKTLTLGTDYTATLGTIALNSASIHITEGGKYTLTINGMGSYVGSKSVDFEVISIGFKKDANGDDYINMPKTGIYYYANIPEGVSSFNVYDDGGAKAQYSNNYDGGLVLTAPDHHVLQLTGTVTAEVQANKLDDYLMVYDGVYDGVSTSAQKIGDKYGSESGANIGTLISSGKQMTLTFHSDPSGQRDGLDLTATLKRDLGSCVIADIDDQPYKGSAIEPAVVITYEGSALVKDGDYEVTYSNNTVVGTATITITGKGNYAGTTSKTFNIVKATPNVSAPAAVDHLIYSGKNQALVVAGTTNFGTLLYSTDGNNYSEGIPTATNVGTYTVYYKVEGSDNWNAVAARTIEATILPSTVMVSVTGNGTVTCGDRSATDGTSFGVMSEKGASVVLTLAPTDGYAARSVAYGYTNNSGTTASGIKLPISGTTATLTVPDDLKDGTGVTVTVTFAPALNGGADEALAVALTDATVTDLGGGWYKVDSDISFDHTLNLLGDTHLIIADGKTMTVNTASNRGIYSDYTLFVSGEGTLSVATTDIAVCVGNYVQTGATVTASGYIGIRCKDDFLGFDFDNDFTFSGGQLTATGSGGGGIDADNDITLSCTNATDFILASSYSSAHGAVKIADGKALTDGTEASNGMNGYSGTLTNEQITVIGGKTLHRAVTTSYVDASGTLHENVIAIPLDNTMTTLAAGWYVVNSDVAYTGTVTLSGDVKLILGDGKAMTVTNTGTAVNDRAIYGDEKTLHIYGQSQGTGALTATTVGGESAIFLETSHDNAGSLLGIHGGVVSASTECASGVAISVQCATDAGGIVIDGGQVTASGKSYGIFCFSGHFDVIGGQVTATGTNGYGLGICDYGINPGVLTLGYSKASDFVSTNSIYNYSGDSSAGEVKIADDQTLVDGNGNIWSGTLSNNEIQSIHNQTLRPVTGVTLTKDGNNVSATFDGTSTTTMSIPVDVNVTSVTYNRAFTMDKPSTVMLPFSKDVNEIGGGTFYTFGGVEKKNNKWEATMNKVTGSLTKNTPYLFVPTGTSLTFTGGATLNTTGGGNCETADEGSHWTFKGTYEYMKWTDDSNDPDYNADREAEIGRAYGFAGVAKTDIEVGDFVRAANGAKIRPMGCYLLWSDTPNAAPARKMTRGASVDELPSRITVRLVGSNGEVTGIGEIDTKTGEMTFDSEAWYTLDGVRLSGKPSKKGLYINNGKKIVIK